MVFVCFCDNDSRSEKQKVSQDLPGKTRFWVAYWPTRWIALHDMVVSHVQLPLSYFLWVNVGELRKRLHGSLDCYLCLDDLKCFRCLGSRRPWGWTTHWDWPLPRREKHSISRSRASKTMTCDRITHSNKILIQSQNKDVENKLDEANPDCRQSGKEDCKWSFEPSEPVWKNLVSAFDSSFHSFRIHVSSVQVVPVTFRGLGSSGRIVVKTDRCLASAESRNYHQQDSEFGFVDI